MSPTVSEPRPVQLLREFLSDVQSDEPDDLLGWLDAALAEAAQPIDVERLAAELYRETVAWSSLPEERMWAEASSQDRRTARQRAQRIAARLSGEEG